jgi:mono/diheme cytochrome c family protein
VRPPSHLLVLVVAALAALGLSACGSEGNELSADEPNYEGSVIFAESCSGCHTLTPAGTQGSGNRSLRQQGPNFDQRTVSFEDALFAIQNGGFSGAIMPQNIVVGEEAEQVARFLEEYAGRDVEEPNLPTPEEEGDLAAEEGGTEPPDEATTSTIGE